MTNNLYPISTYRLQFNNHFTFKQACDLIEYFSALGISHLYASPILKARQGSQHGYDVVDPNILNPELGNENDFKQLLEKLHKHNLGLILDIVPNHMAIGVENPWWMDVLENGLQSAYASYFDINWNPDKTNFHNKVYLPILEKPFGYTLEEGLISVIYQEGKFLIKYHDSLLPTALISYLDILLPLYNEILKLFLNQAKALNLSKILEKINIYSSFDIEERAVLKKDIHQDLHNYFTEFCDIHCILFEQLKVLNGIISNPVSFDKLENFLNLQNYRLCYWKVANDEINYRRFFDIGEYASIRVEDNQVFLATHNKIFELLKQGVSGLRIDHIDGLRDPKKYLDILRGNDEALYIIAEKILTGNEKIRSEWPIQGTVGYDFLNQLNSLYVFQSNKQKFVDIYEKFTGLKEAIKDLKFECKMLLLNTSLASELNLLNIKLNRISSQIRYSRDFTSENLKKALAEIISFFPVYRSYIRAVDSEKIEIHEEDKKYIITAVERAIRNSTLIDPSIYNFIQNVLLLQFREESQKNLQSQCYDFIMHFQQITGPVMAKGLEDTAFYRFYPLSSLNEVGGELGIFGISLENFHKKNIDRFSDRPYSMLSTTTHDTKRSEDVRARINVLSEIPLQWEQAINEWGQINLKYKCITANNVIPDANEEYLFYQTLVGTWPLEGITKENQKNYIERLQKFLEKAIKEAKIHSSWIDANEPYHIVVKDFIERVLNFEENLDFFTSFKNFFIKIQNYGMLNSLSQLILKMSSPGIVDVYQGNELWDFSLVDPDNRRAVDYATRKLQIENRQDFNTIKLNPHDGRIKLYITKQLLELRRKFPQIFTEGAYIPLTIEGPFQDSVIAFARHVSNKTLIILVTRFFTSFMEDFQSYKNKNLWEDNFFMIPSELSHTNYRDIFTGKNYVFSTLKLSLKEPFENFPLAVLESI